MAPAFCVILISGIDRGSHGGTNNSGIPSANLGRNVSIDNRIHSFKFGSFL